ncbi:MAG: hypothetical protein AB8F74_19215 [Saprospiraceae bacterium]
MKSLLHCSLLILFPFFLFAQMESDTLTLAKPDKWSLGYTVVLKHSSLLPSNDIENRSMLLFQSSFNYSIYGDVFFSVNERLTIQTGFALHRNRLNFNDNSLDLGCYYDSDGNFTGIERSFVEYVSDLWYLGIPIGAKLNLIGEDGNSFYTRVSAEFLHNIKGTDRKTFYECGLPSDLSYEELEYASENNNLMLQFSFGAEFKIKGQRCFVEPTAAYSLLSTEMIYASNYFTLDTNINVRYLQIGIGFGIRY